MNATRREDLRSMLEGRRVAGQNQMLGRMRTIRDSATTVDRRVPDDLEGGLQEDIDLALLQINAEIVDRITDARLHVYESGHLFLLQDPDAWPAIAAFLGAAAKARSISLRACDSCLS